ncbi:MAG: hypothetical protein JNL18_20010 [Planctomycetaceae bacterium]|nr:hypothetical protein [Planctomycetaceae bacterium]
MTIRYLLDRARPARLASACLGLACAGCIRQTEIDGIVTFTPHWVDMLLPVAIGLGLLGLGVPIVTGRLPIGRGKPLVLGSLLTMMGLFFFLGAVLTYPFEHVTVSPTQLVIAEGMLGKGISQTVDFNRLDAIELFDARGSGTGPRGTSVVTVMRCHAPGGEIDDVAMEGALRAAALPVVVQRAGELGVKIIDHAVVESE